MIEGTDLWMFITALGVGTFGLRFVFLGLVGNRPMPAWLVRHLRYTAVALIPALVAPLTLWPAATGGAPDPARLLAAGVTLVIGYVTHNVVFAIAAGAITLFGSLALIG